MKKMHTVIGRAVGLSMLCMLTFGATASAQSAGTTVATFSGPVRIANALLPAGTYRFELPTGHSSQDIVAVYSARNEFITIARVLPTRRGDAGPSTVLLSDAPATPPHVSAVYFAGSQRGFEIVYPRPSGTLLASRTR